MMKELLHTLNHTDLEAICNQEKQLALSALETGKVIYFPHYTLPVHQKNEAAFFSETLLSKNRKNISFDPRTKKLNSDVDENSNDLLKDLMHRYSLFSQQLIHTLLPQYTDHLEWGRTSYRPAEIEGRKSSKRKDDTRLHVDSFPSTPVHGKRILRVFSNINPENKPRVWHLGEPFEIVLERFAFQLSPYRFLRSKFLHLLGLTKTFRSPYDHYQLQLHDAMKLDDSYQQSVSKNRMDFPAQSTWIVFTDQVSHAALSGQYLLEQTFYLPVSAMQQQELSPLKCWERFIPINQDNH